MSLNVDTDREADIIAAFDLMEGKGWFESVRRDNALSGPSVYSFDHVCAGRKLRISEGAYRSEDANDVVGTVYGNGGWNRYYSLVNGDVAFSEYHAGYPRERTIANAKALGFVVR